MYEMKCKVGSEIYACNLDQQLLSNIVSASGMVVGKLPMKYLGVPVSAKRLNVGDCDCLVDRMLSKIKVWGSKHLSYAGRAQLINSVLMSMHVYWASIFILPQTVINKITTICRNFLWGGTSIYTKVPLVAWSENCLPKSAGGLGFKNCQDWNLEAMGKYVWFIASKADMLWVKWIHVVYLKGENWWNHSPRSTSSWSWRKVCACRDRMKGGYNGNEWMGNTQRNYTVASGYRWCQGPLLKVHWTWWVWNRLNQPKHSFIGWLMVKNRLQTRAKLVKHKISNNAICPLCDQTEETTEHLFYKCPYSIKCLEKPKQWLNIKIPGDNHIRMMRWINRWKQVGSYAKKVIAACLCDLIYKIWQARNEAVWKQRVPSPDCVILKIKHEICVRMFSLLSTKHRRKQQRVLDRLLYNK